MSGWGVWKVQNKFPGLRHYHHAAHRRGRNRARAAGPSRARAAGRARGERARLGSAAFIREMPREHLRVKEGESAGNLKEAGPSELVGSFLRGSPGRRWKLEGIFPRDGRPGRPGDSRERPSESPRIRPFRTANGVGGARRSGACREGRPTDSLQRPL